MRFAPAHRWNRGMQEWDYVGSLFIVGDAVSANLWNSLETALADILDTHRDRGCLAGCLSRPCPVWCQIGRSVGAGHDSGLIELWAGVRRALWKMPPASLRKY